jgi:hypothetical protein
MDQAARTALWAVMPMLDDVDIAVVQRGDLSRGVTIPGATVTGGRGGTTGGSRGGRGPGGSGSPSSAPALGKGKGVSTQVVHDDDDPCRCGYGHGSWLAGPAVLAPLHPSR